MADWGERPVTKFPIHVLRAIANIQESLGVSRVRLRLEQNSGYPVRFVFTLSNGVSVEVGPYAEYVDDVILRVGRWSELDSEDLHQAFEDVRAALGSARASGVLREDETHE